MSGAEGMTRSCLCFLFIVTSVWFSEFHVLLGGKFPPGWGWDRWERVLIPDVLAGVWLCQDSCYTRSPPAPSLRLGGTGELC